MVLEIITKVSTNYDIRYTCGTHFDFTVLSLVSLVEDTSFITCHYRPNFYSGKTLY